MRKLANALRIDKAIGYSLVFYFWNIASRILTISLTVSWLTPEELGFSYTIASLVAIQVFFEMGLGQVIQQLISYQSCHIEDDTTLAKIHPNMKNYVQIIRNRKLHTDYRAALRDILGPIGVAFFYSLGAPFRVWFPAWALSVANVALTAWTTPKILVLNGCGCMVDVIRVTGLQSILSVVLVGYSYGVDWD